MERPLFWHQGLFLQPQHFQLEDRYLQHLFRPVYKFLHPCIRGVGDLEIAQEALNGGTFSLIRGEFLFPDMSYTGFPGNALCEPRLFGDAWGEAGRPLTVYAGLKKFKNDGENVTVLEKLDNLAEVTTRFVTSTEPDQVQDLHRNGPDAQVKQLFYVLKLFFETEKEQLGDYTLIPIARLQREGEKVVLSEQFIPPCMNIAGSGVLFKLVGDIRDQLAARVHQLEGYKKERGIHTAEFGARDMVFLLALRSLNRYVPLLNHLTESDGAHPWDVYAVLRQLTGELSCFSTQVNLSDADTEDSGLLPAYKHESLWDCFSAARSLITVLLDEITAGPEYVLELAYDGAYFASEMPPAIFEGRNRFYLVFETDQDPDAFTASLETISKLSSREALPILIARSLPGLTLEHLPTPPQELPRRPRSIYFRINHHGEQWAQVQKGNNIALYWDAAPQDLKIELMVAGG
ncbi:MAG: type VI secretion system baseplate subunit TssK [Deltaproteobacteria bacterium]|nr:MAG: type VI secretion system baseplate subunit TssK [Deltaproteobacteria bacterium]